MEPAAVDTAATAGEVLRARPYDVVFLDIQMPGLSGLELAEVIGDLLHRPAVVFVTAFDEHAVQAFELGALDYLMKPVAPDRLRRTIERVRGAVAPAEGGGPPWCRARHASK